MSVEQIKVFGERNTGTNWLESLVMNNYDIPVIHHRQIIKQKTTEAEQKFIESLPKKNRIFVRERVNDCIFEYRAKHLFGWKHTAVISDGLEQHPEFKKTGFVFIVKHPYTFIKSLHKRPYHALTEVPQSVDKFITTPWPTLHRDNINQPLLSSPVELWNHKVRSYFKFLELNRENAVLFRYESLLENHELLFKSLEEKLCLASKSRLPVLESTKPADRLGTADYRAKYLQKEPASGLNTSSIQLMKSLLDPQLVKQCQYKL